MITVIGIFADIALAEQAGSYLLANEFMPENVDMHTQGNAQDNNIGSFFGHLFNDESQAAHYASIAQNGTVITVHAANTREAQEAVDVFNNHGAIEVDLDEGNRRLVINKVIEPDKRLRDR